MNAPAKRQQEEMPAPEAELAARAADLEKVLAAPSATRPMGGSTSPPVPSRRYWLTNWGRTHADCAVQQFVTPPVHSLSRRSATRGGPSGLKRNRIASALGGENCRRAIVWTERDWCGVRDGVALRLFSVVEGTPRRTLRFPPCPQRALGGADQFLHVQPQLRSKQLLNNELAVALTERLCRRGRLGPSRAPGQVTDASARHTTITSDLMSRLWHDVVVPLARTMKGGRRSHRPRLADNDGGPVAVLSR